jgi:hypothetical protein
MTLHEIQRLERKVRGDSTHPSGELDPVDCQNLIDEVYRLRRIVADTGNKLILSVDFCRD